MRPRKTRLLPKVHQISPSVMAEVHPSALRSMRGVEAAGRSGPLRRTANPDADSPPGGTPSDGGRAVALRVWPRKVACPWAARDTADDAVGRRPPSAKRQCQRAHAREVRSRRTLFAGHYLTRCRTIAIALTRRYHSCCGVLDLPTVRSLLSLTASLRCRSGWSGPRKWRALVRRMAEHVLKLPLTLRGWGGAERYAGADMRPALSPPFPVDVGSRLVRPP
jgi:hypothetical protein